MPTYSAKGSAGAPVTPTVWMAPLADKLTMLTRSISDYSGGAGNFITYTPTSSPVTAANYINQFLPFHASLGAFITAPDGTTNTAQKIVEDNTTNFHYLEAGSPNTNYISYARIAGIFKAAERTRVCIAVGDTDSHTGIAAGFDLAGGQIAYGPQAFGFVGSGDPFVGIAATMVQVVSGWWLCMLDVKTNVNNYNSGFNGHCIFARILPDNGSGTAAISVNYAGDGSSGLYGWRSSMLPIGAWSINKQVFFDDFTDPTLANFDINSTFVDGFDWYLQHYTPGNIKALAIPRANLVQSGSSLTVLPTLWNNDQTTGFTPALCSAGNPGDGRAHCAKGRNVYVPPVYYEVKAKLPYIHFADGSEISISFFQTVEFSDTRSAAADLTTGIGPGGTAPYARALTANVNWNIGAWSPTWSDWGGGSALIGGGVGGTQFTTAFGGGTVIDPNNSANFWGSNSYGPSGVVQQGVWGIPQWTAAIDPFEIYYLQTVFSPIDSNFYTGNVPSTVLGEPPNSNWVSYSYPPGSSNPVWQQPAIHNDPSQFAVYGLIIIPYNRTTKEPGIMLAFHNNVFLGAGEIWSPNPGVGFADSVSHTTDWQQLILMMQTGYTSQAITDSYCFTYDYVKVMQ